MGADGLFNTADDVLVPLTVSYSNDVATLTFAGLTEGVYRLTIDDTIANGKGTRLDGNGTSVSNWVSDFVVVPSGTLLGSAATVGLSGTDPLAVATGDFNGDGKLDLVVADSGSSTVEVLLNNGNGTFTDSSSYSITYSGYYGIAIPYAVTVGDFNGDGKLDFAVASFAQSTRDISGTIEVFLGNGKGTFTFASEYQGTGSGTGFDPISIVAADFNGDGKLDLAVANYYQGLVDVPHRQRRRHVFHHPRDVHGGHRPSRPGGRRLQRRRSSRPGRGELRQQHCLRALEQGRWHL